MGSYKGSFRGYCKGSFMRDIYQNHITDSKFRCPTLHSSYFAPCGIHKGLCLDRARDLVDLQRRVPSRDLSVLSVLPGWAIVGVVLRLFSVGFSTGFCSGLCTLQGSGFVLCVSKG